MSLSIGAGSHNVEANKRHSRSLDLEQTNARQIRQLHQRSASENDGLVESQTIERQVPSKVFSLYKKFSTRHTKHSFLPEIKPTATTATLTNSRTSFGSSFSNLLSKNQLSLYQINKENNRKSFISSLLAQTGESRRSLPNSLQNDIAQFAIDGYAQKYFTTHKKGLFRRRVTMNEMMQWTCQSIKQPLLLLSNKKEATKCFKILQILMDDRPKPKNYDSLENFQYLLDCGIAKGQMRDEIYVQICRQLNNNPTSASRKKGWEILCVVCVTFPPSKDLESYLFDFVNAYHSTEREDLNIFSRYVADKLTRICLKGARGKVLSVNEIERAMEAPFKPSVFGESLDTVLSLEKDPTLKIPRIVIFLTHAVHELNGKKAEGIFRVPGDADTVTELRVRIENGIYELNGIDDPNVPASLLKYWLRDLVEPLIPTNLYLPCVQSANDTAKAVAIVNSLPDYNRRIVLYIVRFLQEFIEPEVTQYTRMNIFNLAMVFAPNFLRCPFTHLPTIFQNAKYEQTFVKNLVEMLEIDKEACAYQEGEFIGVIKQ
ncbi:Rho GTPase activation protein [Sporodiniella umbellata]|nr:Rho GTPase activation protein [Sporodiniella umbellata]